MTPKRILLFFLILTVTEFLPSFDNSFRDDDFVFLEHVVESSGTAALLSPSEAFAFYRPGALALFALEYRLFGFHGGLYVLFNFLLHLAIGAVFWRIAHALTEDGTTAAIAAGLFLVGLTHYGKQVMWACTSGALVATLLTCASVYLAVRLAKKDASLSSLVPMLVAGVVAPTFHESGILASVLAAACFAVLGPRRAWLVVVALAPALAWGLLWAALPPIFTSHDTAPAQVFAAAGRGIRYVGFMFVPLQSTQTPLAAAIQTISGSIIAMALVVTLWKGDAARRFLVVWLLLALAPFCFVELPGSWLELRYVYAAAPPLLLLLSMALRATVKKHLQIVIPVALAMGSVFIVHTLEKKYAAESTSERNASRLETIEQSAE